MFDTKMGAHNVEDPYKGALDKILKDIRARNSSNAGFSAYTQQQGGDPISKMFGKTQSFDQVLSQKFSESYKTEPPISVSFNPQSGKKKGAPAAPTKEEIDQNKNNPMAILSGYKPPMDLNPAVKAQSANTEAFGQALLALSQLASVRRGGPVSPITGERVDRAISATDAATSKRDNDLRQYELMELQTALAEMNRDRDISRENELLKQDREHKTEREERAYQWRDDQLEKTIQGRLDVAESRARGGNYPEGMTRLDFENALHKNRLELQRAKESTQIMIARMQQDGSLTAAALRSIPQPVVLYQEPGTSQTYTLDDVGATMAFNSIATDPEVYKYISDTYGSYMAKNYATLSKDIKHSLVQVYIDRVPKELRQKMSRPYDPSGPAASFRGADNNEDNDPMGIFR
jgi:hypothetical protein